LRNLLGDPGLLQRVIALGAQAFDGGDLLADSVADRGPAGSNGFAVDVAVQAPHGPAPQPNFVPVICNCSRIAHRSGVSFTASTDIFRPLMFKLVMFPPKAVSTG
jgi:hypothetical protein